MMNLETRIPAALWEAVKVNYEKREFSGAIIDGFYFLSDMLRKKSGVDGDGATLIGQALGGATPKIKLNKLQTESEQNIQKGMEQLLRGLYLAGRNPRSHEKTADTEEDAQALLHFIGYLVRQIDQAKSPFSKADFIKRVLDPDFVPRDRYAELLCSEIPPGQRLEVFLETFRVKETGTISNLRYFFGELLKLLTHEELKQVYEVISQELKTTDDETIIRTILGGFPSNIWPLLDESARLRIENKLIRSINDGRYSKKQDRCRGGALGTWATGFFPHFSLKPGLLLAITEKLDSKDVEERDYIFKYLFFHLGEIEETMPRMLENRFRAGLKAGYVELYDHLDWLSPWPMESWSPELRKAFEEFKPNNSELTKDKDDTDNDPF